jgi:uncharacterized Ntn-hydrolase superfamily protein
MQIKIYSRCGEPQPRSGLEPDRGLSFASRFRGTVLGGSMEPGALLLLMMIPFQIHGATVSRPSVPAHTYSIVARDPVTHDLGVAVQSHYFSVGGAVPWAESGVGVVATQSFTQPSYGPLGLALMKSGRSAPEALDELVQKDPGEAVRQVAMVDAQGRAAAHTGAQCIEEAGHHVGEGYSVQANLMADSTVWGAMSAAYEAAVTSGHGDLADHLLAALDAAQAAGGDIRGQQSAALLIVRAVPGAEPGSDRLFDLRVEDHPKPLEELRRLVRVQRAYRLTDEGDRFVAQEKFEDAARAYAEAAAMAPDNTELVFWQAVTLWKIGRKSDARPLFAQVFAAPDGDNWRRLVPRLVRPGLLPFDPDSIREITEIKGKRRD